MTDKNRYCPICFHHQTTQRKTWWREVKVVGVHPLYTMEAVLEPGDVRRDVQQDMRRDVQQDMLHDVQQDMLHDMRQDVPQDLL